MSFVLSPAEMRAADAEAMELAGDVQLMRNAGEKIAHLLHGDFIVGFAGPGNNGGDVFAAFARARELGNSATFMIFAASGEGSTARQDAEARASAAEIPCEALPRTPSEARSALAGADLIVDGLFGTGARLPLPEPYATIVSAINDSRKPVLAIDIPSGTDAGTGAVAGAAVRATTTVTLGALKPGLLLDPAAGFAGTVTVADIGIPAALLKKHARTFQALDDAAFLDLLPARPYNADKRSAGAPLIIAGSQQFPGAAVLCAQAAARAGAGYVTVATPAKAAASLRAHLIEQVVTEIAEDAPVESVVEQLLDTAKHCTSVGIGPGLGLDERTGDIIRRFLRMSDLPFVADASALFHFAKHVDILNTARAVITPHAGEFARLSGKGSIRDGERIARLREFVSRTHCTTLLKGATTLVDDGTTVHLNLTGTNALATAGTGDVLTGMIATLLSQGLQPADAARCAAYWHGLAAQYCAKKLGRGVIAGDLPGVLGKAIDTVCADDFH